MARKNAPELDRYDKMATAAGYQHSDRLVRIMAWTEDQRVTTQAAVEAAADQGWPVYPIDATRSPTDVRDQAFEAIAQHLDSTAKEASQPGA